MLRVLSVATPPCLNMTRHGVILSTHMPLKVFYNEHAASWSYNQGSKPGVLSFHRLLPDYKPTRLISLPPVAKEIGVAAVLVKDETLRLGLPAFKILGASYAIYRALISATRLHTSCLLEEVGASARKLNISLVAATDGNHGRAVAKMASILGLKAYIYVPSAVSTTQRDSISDEGATVIIVDGDYDFATATAFEATKGDPTKMLIQDNAFPGYEGEIPNVSLWFSNILTLQWIIEGYSTMLQETDQQAQEILGRPVNMVISPCGVGSLTQAVVTHFKNQDHKNVTIASVEADSAACVLASMTKGEAVTVPTGTTIMEGMNCGTVSLTAWPILKLGLDIALSVSDLEAHEAVKSLNELGVASGPCGAAPLAGLRLLAAQPDQKILNEETVVLLLCTEQSRPYTVPQG
jgi:diaminopropionate ammonia-lyase